MSIKEEMMDAAAQMEENDESEMAADFLVEVSREIARARAKFPEGRHNLAVLMVQVGDLADHMVEQVGSNHSARIYVEAVQVAAMAARVALEGDPSFRS